MKSAQLRILLASALVAAVSVAPAAAQRPLTPEQRMMVLEQQVAASQATAMRLEQRLDLIERQLQQLINQGEVNAHKASQVQAEIATLRSETESRLRNIESRAGSQPAEIAAIDSTPSQPRTEAINSAPPQPAGGGGDSGGSAESDPGEDAYSEGFRLWRDGKYDQSITALRAFVSGFPKHRRVSFARNLIGRALLDKGQPRPAAEALLANYRADPRGERAPDSLYYLGQALMQLDQASQACKAYAELEDVYGASVRADLKALVSKAKADARCG